MRTNAENFVKNYANESPRGANIWPKFEILSVLGVVFPYFCPDKGEIWHGGVLSLAKFYLYRSNVSPLRGEKPIFVPLSKNNTSMAALCAGLSVIIR